MSRIDIDVADEYIKFKTMGYTSMSPGPDYAIVRGSLALINAGIAQGKNRSCLNWFLRSLLFWFWLPFARKSEIWQFRILYGCPKSAATW